MLRTIHTMEELDISGWMEVYREGHEENGAYFYPDEPPERALHLAEEDSRRFLEGFFQIPGAQYWIWEEEGRYVSCLRLKPDRDGLLLEALETRPDCRRERIWQTIDSVGSVPPSPRHENLFGDFQRKSPVFGDSSSLRLFPGFGLWIAGGRKQGGSLRDHGSTI